MLVELVVKIILIHRRRSTPTGRKKSSSLKYTGRSKLGLFSVAFVRVNIAWLLLIFEVRCGDTWRSDQK